MSPGMRYRLSGQRGVALVVSLVLLVVMSLVAVSTLSGSRLSERMAGNAQQKAIAFQVAESAIESGFDIDQLLAALEAIPVGEYDDPAPRHLGAFDAAMSTGYDQSRLTRAGSDTPSVDIEGAVSIQYCGESPLPNGSSLSADESDTQLIGLLFDVNGVARVASSATQADHIQRGSLVRPKSGRSGACVARGVTP